MNSSLIHYSNIKCLSSKCNEFLFIKNVNIISVSIKLVNYYHVEEIPDDFTWKVIKSIYLPFGLLYSNDWMINAIISQDTKNLYLEDDL